MTRRRGIVIAIDGPAGAGKSTVARLLAERLGYTRVDTGALYRAVALVALERGVSWDDGAALGELAASLELGFTEPSEGRRAHVVIDGADREADIRAPRVSDGASKVSAHGEVRAALLELQRRLGADGGVVLEGRDIGTVVFPDAELKVFLTASDEERARRRTAELAARGEAAVLEDVLEEMRARDRRDSSRPLAPLKPADEAIRIDTTGLTLDEAVTELEALARAYLRAGD